MRPVKVLVKDIGDVLVLISTGLALLAAGQGGDTELEVIAGATVLTLLAAGQGVEAELEVIAGAAVLDEVHERDQLPEVVGDAGTGNTDIVDTEVTVPDVAAVVQVEFQDGAVTEKAGLLVEVASDEAAGETAEVGEAVAVVDPEMLGWEADTASTIKAGPGMV